MCEKSPIILASGSATRKTMLANAGIEHIAEPANVDEGALKKQALAEGLPPPQIALKLAIAKAMDVSPSHQSSFIVGSDQILELEGELLTKTTNRSDALSKLRKLQGKTHRLHSAVACIREGNIEFEFVDTAELTMKRMSDQELERYIDRAGPGIFGSVGCYQIEGLGIKLFNSVHGSHFTILGMPLLPLIGFLDHTCDRSAGA